MPLAVFANDAFTTATSTYGTTSPASGTSETWVMTSNTGFPVASPSAVPPTWFHLVDQALPSESIAVTANPSTSWTVTRGAEGTTPVAHAAGATYYAVVSAGDYAGLGTAGANAAGPTVAGLGLGLLTVPPFWCTVSATCPAQQMQMSLVTATASVAVTTLGCFMTTLGVTPGTGVNQISLFSEAGVLLATTGDMTTQFTAAVPHFAEGAIANPGGITSFNIIAGANYYLAILANFTGTPPKIAYTGQAISGATTLVLNGHRLNGFITAQAAVPSSFTPSAMTIYSETYCLYAR